MPLNVLLALQNFFVRGYCVPSKKFVWSPDLRGKKSFYQFKNGYALFWGLCVCVRGGGRGRGRKASGAYRSSLNMLPGKSGGSMEMFFQGKRGNPGLVLVHDQPSLDLPFVNG